jgi:hypothetical protein
MLLSLNKDGPLTFFENPGQTLCGTAYPAWVNRNQRLGQSSIEITVEGMNFSKILGLYGIPYYLKVDIEGADVLCLQALKHFESKPKYVSIESSKTSWKNLRNEFALLKVLGYSRFKVVPQHATVSQECPCPEREGRYVGPSFRRRRQRALRRGSARRMDARRQSGQDLSFYLPPLQIV